MPRKKDKARPSRGRLIVLGALLLGLGGVTGALAYANYLVRRLPDVSYLRAQNPGETALMKERGGRRIQYWVALEDISPWVIRAVIASEDASFYSHRGFDLYEMREAFLRNWEEGRTVRGASTITQQLAKNLYLSTERTYSRKLKEALLAYRLEQSLEKSRILEIYLNVIEWGQGIYGVEAAARDVFGRSSRGLGPAQAATLAAMIPNPTRFHPCVDPDALRARRDRVLGYLHRGGKLDEDEFRAALDSEPRLRGCGSSS